MAQSKTIRSDEYDSIVIGAGLSGLIAANLLESTGRKVALVEALDTIGGSSRPVQTPAGLTDRVLKFFPEFPESEETFQWLESLLGQTIAREIIEEPPVTYDDGKFKPFLGFGDQKVETAAEVAAYARSRFYRLGTTPKDWVTRLTETFTGTLFTQSFVTKMQTDDEFVIELTINGSKRLSAREVIFCAGPQQLVRLLPDTHVPGRLRQRLVKGDFWTSANLELVHNSVVTESAAIHILKGANEEPSIGLFHPPTKLANGQDVQVSQWLTLVNRDVTDDSELVASALKHIKRQIKRAYETSLDGLIKERITVTPISHGDLTLAMPDDGKWPKLQNLWVISGFMDTEKNVWGALRQVRRTMAALAGEPAEVIEPSLETGPQPTA